MINPRPLGYSMNALLLQNYTIGFSGYSDGCNDDLNKIIWSSLHWNPSESIEDIVDQYSRYFIGYQWQANFSRVYFHQ
jgi:hypothetical protein